MEFKFNNIFKKWLLLPFVALLTFCFTEVLSRRPDFAETYYSQTIYPLISKLISTITGIFPFSIDDLFYIFLIISIFSLIVLLILRKITLKNTGKIVVNLFAATYVLFYFLWGFNYYRLNLNARIGLAEQQTNTTEFIKVFENIISETNKSYCTFDDFNKTKIDSLIEQAYQQCAQGLGLKYPSGKRKDKQITFSSFFAKAGISGYFGPFFNEVHVNKKVLPIEYPYVLAHEKAHQFGITSEAEANFYSWLVCTQSSSKQLHYSANLNILRYYISQAYQLEDFSKIVSKLDDNVKADLNRVRKHWMELRNEKVDMVASKMNDTYLKTNKVEKGIQDYKGVVQFVMDYSLDSVFQKTHNLSTN